MSEVFAEALSLVNLPFTVLLGLVVAYWLLVAIGALDSNFGADSDMDLQMGHDVDHDFQHDAPHGGDGHADGGGVGWIAGMLQFINIGEVPVMVVCSVLSLCLWMSSMIANHYFTGHNALLALAFVVPNLLVSAVATRYLTLPLQPLFRMIRRAEGEAKPLVGQACRVTTSTVNSSFGQAEVETQGAPLLIDVRTIDGVTLPRGSHAVIFREDSERGVYYVAAIPNPELP